MLPKGKKHLLAHPCDRLEPEASTPRTRGGGIHASLHFCGLTPEVITHYKRGNQWSPSRHKGRVLKKRWFWWVRQQGRCLWRVETGTSSLALPIKINAFSGSRRPPGQAWGTSLVSPWDTLKN